MIENIIKKILDFDEMEREMLVETKANRSSVEDEIAKKCAEIKKFYTDKFETEIDLYKKTERDNADKILGEKENSISIQLKRFDDIYAQNKDRWIEELYNRVIK